MRQLVLYARDTKEVASLEQLMLFHARVSHLVEAVEFELAFISALGPAAPVHLTLKAGFEVSERPSTNPVEDKNFICGIGHRS